MPQTDYENAKKEVQILVEKFNQVNSSGKLKGYNEENTKKDFITPLFRALGWDVENRHSPDEVTNEDRVSKGRVDYSFRMNGIPKFFLEAKAINKGIDEAKDAAQAISYAFHKNTTWAVLTNFESLAIYNAEVKEKTISDARFIILNYNQYLEEFPKLWLLSKQGFLEELLDKSAESWGKKLKKTKVGDQLLSELMYYRELLSKNIVKNNPKKNLSQEEVDEAVQRIIDRLIFIRTTEDRNIEPPTLAPLVREYADRKRGQLTHALNEVYLRFDKTYNSKLFTFNPADLTQRHLCETLEIDNETLISVLEGLYQSLDGLINFDFSAIDADVLGNIYEQYLSHILRKTDKRAKVESKEAHRKEQGIYYTPTYIVDYIVRNTLGELLKSKKPAEVDEIKVLDMACGSGSFLLKAFDVLDDYYRTHDKNYAQSTLDMESDVAKITRKTKILRNNIHGVDLDPKAVEIAQLNLLLKAAETRHLLPDLRDNVKCGNSLVDQSFAEDTRAFDWKNEFQDIVQNGGFDVIIGNPPYVRQEEFLPIKPFLQQNYEVFAGTADLFVYFFERELKLLKNGGYFGMIVSNKWLKAGYGLNLRKFLSKFYIEQFIDFGDLKVFQDATTYPCIIIVRKLTKPNSKIRICQPKTLTFDSLERYIQKNSFTVDQRVLDVTSWNFQNKASSNFTEKIKRASTPLKDYVGENIFRGVLTGLNAAFVIDEQTRNRLIREDSNSEKILPPFLTGNEVRRYSIASKGKYLIFTRRGIDIDEYPAIKRYLEKFKVELTPKKNTTQTVGRKPGDYKWYEIQDTIAYYKEFEKPKLIYGKITTHPRFSIDRTGYIINDSNFFFPIIDFKLLAILNSKLGWFLISNTCTEIQGGYQLIWKYFGNVPIAKAKSPELERLAEKMLSLNERLLDFEGKSTDESARLEKEIADTDRKIDSLVYDLYGLTEEERKIVEESVGK
ncbi:N-6 DNA methylase [Candidatus Micrarchaeota archaeon]|nr:N-6 DNA methylase [Candidatus Micrarchaeota archaeon]